MDINVFKTFLAVCEYNGFSAAGEKLGYSQSTVSSQIKLLEKELDVTLFDRIRHNVTPTADGETVLRYTKQMLELYQEMGEALHSTEEIMGDIKLAVSESICARYFKDDYLAFHEKYPGINLKISQSGTGRMFDALRKNEVDIVFTLDSHIYDSEFLICGESLEQVHFVASPKHPLAKAKSLKLKEIVDQKFFLTEQNMSYQKLLNARLASESLEIHPVLEVGDPNLICTMIKESNEISFLPDFITKRYIGDGRLVYLPVEDCQISVWTQMLMHKNKWKSAAMEAFVEYYKKIIAK
ncbi:MAG: LysR family transcriptional regulator [Lachnospiraceae bacterium]|nr:LysR family transcriptional regulator [Lachnospiraceae bacterium]